MIQRLPFLTGLFLLYLLPVNFSAAESVYIPAHQLKIQLPYQITDIQHSDQTSKTTLTGTDQAGTLIQLSFEWIILDDFTLKSFIHPTDISQTNLIELDKGGDSELAIIQMLRSWLKTQKLPTKEDVFNESNHLSQQSKNQNHPYIVISILTALEKNFDTPKFPFKPKYNCFDIHGDFQCFIESDNRPVENLPDFNLGDVIPGMGCKTDADCYPTKDGGCVTGSLLATLIKDNIQDTNSAVRCQCKTGPVEFGCVPIHTK